MDWVRALARASEVHMFCNRSFGKLLVRQLANMKAAEEPVRLMALESTTHAMVVGLKIKQEDGKSRFVVKFYDPNFTTSHQRVASDNLSAFESLSLASFIPEDLYDDYYREGGDLSLAFISPKAQGEPAVVDPGMSAPENRTLTSGVDDENVNATMLWHMLAKGFAGTCDV